MNDEGKVLRSILEELGTNKTAGDEIDVIFNKEIEFDYPKPESLIKTILELTTNPGDLVLDSFLGSGTTAAVAHKMGRRWIGIELGDHCNTHCVPRLQKVIDGSDQGGISKAVEWKGGGGFKYYRLAPSLLKKDDHDHWIINPEYNADMLAAAVAKQEGFHYEPHPTIYWKQGKSTERDYIFVTTMMVTSELVDRIADQMAPGESLLICCKTYRTGSERRIKQIQVKKIPNMLMGRCEYGKEDYSLHIISAPRDMGEGLEEEDISQIEPDEENTASTKKNRKKSTNSQNKKEKLKISLSEETQLHFGLEDKPAKKKGSRK